MPGSGLGLAIVRQVVDRHGGRVEASRGARRRGRCAPMWVPPASPSPQLEDAQQPLGLPLRLGPLVGDVGLHGDAAAGAERPGAAAVGHQRADDDAEVGRAVAADPAERTGVRAPRGRLDLLDDLHRPQLGRSGHRAGREQRAQRAHGADVVAEPAAHRRDELVHRRVGLDLHQRRHLDGADLADQGQVVAEQVDDHQVLGARLRVGGQPHALRLVLLRRRAARGGALDRLGLEVPVGGDQGVPLRRARQQPRPGAVDVVLEEPGVRRGVELAQPEVGRHRVEVGLAGRAGGSG